MRFSIRSRYTESPGVEELAQAGSVMVLLLAITTAGLLQVLDDSPVSQQRELAVK